MTTFKEAVSSSEKFTLAEVVNILGGGQLPIRVTAYDGSSAGPADSPYSLHLRSPRGTSYLATAPGDLGFARAYISGDLEAGGVHPADPYDLIKLMAVEMDWKKPDALTMAKMARSIGLENLKPMAPPPQEALPRWRRIAEGLRSSRGRDAEAIKHHYDVSNDFYELVLGPSMAYTCAKYPNLDATLEEAQENKYRLVFDKLGLKAGDRLLDVGCGWGTMVRYAARRGVHVIGVTLSKEQATWAQEAIAAEGLQEFAQVRHGDYRDVSESGFDAVSSIGLTEHIGVGNYPNYFKFLRSKLKANGRLLIHTITRFDSRVSSKAGSFIDRYVFPDGELTGSGRLIAAIQDAGGMEVVHEENLRSHYAMTLRDWNRNLLKNWDAAVDEVGIGTARVWGLYMAGARLGFEHNRIQLHQVLAVKVKPDGTTNLPLNQWWKS